MPIERVRRALATNLSDLLRYQNMLCRYDTTALKSLDIFSVHGFPVGLVQCESNLLGIVNGNGVNVGSGGWTNIIEKYARAKSYCDAPFEVRRQGRRKVTVPIRGEWIGERRNGEADAFGHAALRELDQPGTPARQSRRGLHRPALLRQRAVRRADGFLLRLAAAAGGDGVRGLRAGRRPVRPRS